MALPAGITSKTVTVGPFTNFDGSVCTGRVTIGAPETVIYTPTNAPLVPSDMVKQLQSDGTASFALCPTDAPGLNRTDWTYRLSIEISGASKQFDVRNFTLPTAGPDTIDLDSLVTVPSSAGTPVSVTVVTSVNGQTGAVTVAGGSGGSVTDATTSAKGVVQLAGDLGGTAASPTVPGLASKVNTPSGGTDGQALVKSGSNVVWGTVAGGGSTTTDASQLVSGTLPPARIGDASIADAKLASGTALAPAERTKLTGIATGATANATDAQLRDRSTHTGTQAASTITGLATVATSGAYTDLSGRPGIPSTPLAQNLIVDTDYATDPDDVAALQIALNQHKRGVVNLLAVVVSSTPTSNQAAQGVQAHLANQGLSTVPIGQWVGTNANVEGNSPFLATLRSEYTYTTAAGGFENSIRTIRRALAAAPNGSVNYAAIGFLNNLSAVLQSPADDLSSMTGQQLFAAKVARVVMQGSSSTPATDTNWSSDSTATGYVLANCPVPMEWQRIDVGGGILIGRALDPLPAKTFVRRALEAGTQAGISNLLAVGVQSPDPMVVLSACYSAPEQIGLTRTNATVAWNTGTGIATFTNSAGATNYYVSKSTTVVPLLTAALEGLLVPGSPEVARGASVAQALANANPLATGAGTSLWNAGNIETTPRFGLLDQSPATGELWLSYFTAPVDALITKLGLQMGGTAGASNTLARIALFTADAGDNLTKVAQIASDPTLGNANYYNPTRALSTTSGFPAAYALQAGQRYALGVLFVGGTMPTISGQNTGNGGTAPVLSRKITGQSDIANSYTVGSLATDFRCMYLFGLAS